MALWRDGRCEKRKSYVAGAENKVGEAASKEWPLSKFVLKENRVKRETVQIFQRHSGSFCKHPHSIWIEMDLKNVGAGDGSGVKSTHCSFTHKNKTLLKNGEWGLGI